MFRFFLFCDKMLIGVEINNKHTLTLRWPSERKISMKIKGESIIAVPDLIRVKFGTSGLEKWMASLSEEARAVYASVIEPYEWYDLKTIYLEPVEKICDLFYNGSYEGAIDAGRADAERVLGGVYKLFVRFGSPGFIIRRGSVLFPSYYKDAAMELVEIHPKGCLLRLNEFGGEKMEKINEFTIKGWMERAMELCGCTNVVVKPEWSNIKEKETLQFVASWD